MSNLCQSLEEWKAPGHSFFYKGHDIFFRVAGDESLPCLLLIHGFPSASWDWHKIWPTLSKKFHLIAPDMIGFGFSDKPQDYDYSIFDQADLCEALLGQLKIRDYHILAHDYGDTVAQELLARNTNQKQILSCVFLNGGLFPETHKPVLIQKLLISPLGPLVEKLFNRNSFERTMKNIFGTDTQPSDTELESLWQLLSHKKGRGIIHQLIRYMAERKIHRERWVGALRGGSVPLRLIDGTTDPISGAHMVARYRELVPDADVVMLEKIGHYPQIEAPDEIIEAFASFHTRNA